MKTSPYFENSNEIKNYLGKNGISFYRDHSSDGLWVV